HTEWRQAPAKLDLPWTPLPSATGGLPLVRLARLREAEAGPLRTAARQQLVRLHALVGVEQHQRDDEAHETPQLRNPPRDDPRRGRSAAGADDAQGPTSGQLPLVSARLY